MHVGVQEFLELPSQQLLQQQGVVNDALVVVRDGGQGPQLIGYVVAAEDDGLGLEGDGGDFVEHLKDLASEAPVIRLVNTLIGRVTDLRASDTSGTV